MALTNYTELVAAVTDYMAGANVSGQIPDFITLAEETINRRLRQAGRIATDTVTTDVDGIGDLPDDFRELRSVAITSPYRATLSQITAHEAANTDTTAGTTSAYQLIGRMIQVFPPGVAELTITFAPGVPPLTAATPTNWLLTTSPRVYLYGALTEAAVLTRDNESLAIWKPLFESSLEDLVASEAASQWASGRIRILEPTP
jgi:hypothetical protein